MSEKGKISSFEGLEQYFERIVWYCGNLDQSLSSDPTLFGPPSATLTPGMTCSVSVMRHRYHSTGGILVTCIFC